MDNLATHAPRQSRQPIKVLLVDDHPLMLAAVGSIIKREYPDLLLVGSAANGNEAHRIHREEKPDVIVLDLELGDEYGLDLIPGLTQAHPARIIIFTGSEDRTETLRAYAAGACAVVSKIAPLHNLIKTIRDQCPKNSYSGQLS